MKPYMLVEGSSQAIDAFEQKVAAALEMGYVLAGELATNPHSSDIKFYQPMVLDEGDEGEEEEWEDEEEEDD